MLRPGGGGLTAVYQPVLDLRDDRVVAYEGFVRGLHEGRTVVPAPLFAAARASGRLTELDRFAMSTVIREAASWLDGWRLFVHALPGTLDPSRIAELARTCMLLGLEPADLVLEIPAQVPGNVFELRAVAVAAHREGMRVALDDARADDRSLQLLRLIHPDVLKVDMAVTQDLPSSYDELAELVDVAQVQNAEVVLQGVETAAQEQAARQLHIDLVQGYRYQAPLAPHEIVTGEGDALVPAATGS